ncbi:MAG TPA: hypothetical protein VJV96_03665 [Candidatus Angelobacter sp.]|jgi:hypothetical protein|nr:hypothetical protein [Candidatus Angelobacter sp.]
MDDYQKWLEAAAGIEEDIQYLKASLNTRDLGSLQTALAVYLKNACTGVAWPRPDDLYCIQELGPESQRVVATATRPDYKLAC